MRKKGSMRPLSFLLLLLPILSVVGAHRFLASSAETPPWRRRPSYSTNRPPPTAYDDYSSHFMDLEDARKDKRSRQWTVNLRSRRPGVMSLTSRLVTANILCYALQVFRPSFTSWGIKLSDKILNGQELYRLVTPMFLHGSPIHIMTNMASLTNSGPVVEKLFGPGRFLATYAASGVAGTLLSAIRSPNPSLGASGAVFGVFGAYLVFLGRNEWLFGSQGEAAMSSIIGTLGANAFLGFVVPSIDNWGHLGGFLGGAAMAYYFGPRLFLSDLPGGGRIVVDKPIVRLPRPIESIPEQVGKRFSRITRRMRIERFKDDMSDKPWRLKRRNNYRQRQSAPNRSIKPADF